MSNGRILETSYLGHLAFEIYLNFGIDFRHLGYLDLLGMKYHVPFFICSISRIS